MPGEFQQTRKHKREVLRVEDLNDANLAAIALAEPPAWARRFDSEFDPGTKPHRCSTPFPRNEQQEAEVPT
jgi:hypothetical protein